VSDKIDRGNRPAHNRPAIARPDWIKVRAISADVQSSMAASLTGCNTVCLSAKCPNLGECFSRGVATFMIGGPICTRACRFCGVNHGVPGPLDTDEPRHVAESVAKLGLKFVVVTGVARDDLPDGSAFHYAETVRAIRELNPSVQVEILIPDFGASESALKTVLDSGPIILNHNLETVRRLTPKIRSKATYDRSLQVLDLSHKIAPHIPTKSGLMVGLGETFDEVVEALHDLANIECKLITIGQYLQPRANSQIAVERYWTPDEFANIKNQALSMGFTGVASGPFVRSSYFAEELATNS
jgi:lipoyl synthase